MHTCAKYVLAFFYADEGFSSISNLELEHQSPSQALNIWHSLSWHGWLQAFAACRGQSNPGLTWA